MFEVNIKNLLEEMFDCQPSRESLTSSQKNTEYVYLTYLLVKVPNVEI